MTLGVQLSLHAMMICLEGSAGAICWSAAEVAAPQQTLQGNLQGWLQGLDAYRDLGCWPLHVYRTGRWARLPVDLEGLCLFGVIHMLLNCCRELGTTAPQSIVGRTEPRSVVVHCWLYARSTILGPCCCSLVQDLSKITGKGPAKPFSPLAMLLMCGGYLFLFDPRLHFFLQFCPL